MKPGPPINLLQFLLGVIALLLAAIGLYVKAEVRAQHQDDRIEAIERIMTKNEGNAQIRKAARDLEMKEHKDGINQNSQDIKILQVTKQDKR